LTEEIDCPCNPTSRDPIHLSFQSFLANNTFCLFLTLSLNSNLIVSLTIYIKHGLQEGAFPSIYQKNQLLL